MSVSRAPKVETSGDDNMSVFNTVVGVSMAVVAICGILLIVVNEREQGVVIVNGSELRYQDVGVGGHGLAISGGFLVMTAIMAICRLALPGKEKVTAGGPDPGIFAEKEEEGFATPAEEAETATIDEIEEAEEGTPKPVAESTARVKWLKSTYTLQKTYPATKKN